MSLDWWAMKMSGGYVIHDGMPRQIEDMRYDDEDYSPDYRAYPEDVIDEVRFYLTGVNGTVGYDDFNIIFPDDQTFLTQSGYLSVSSRRMNRQYKIAPTADTYGFTAGGIYDFLMWVKDPQYSDLEELYIWDQQDKVFNKDLGLKYISRNTAEVWWKGRPIYEYVRRDDHYLLRRGEDCDPCPPIIEDKFKDLLDWRIPHSGGDAPPVRNTRARTTFIDDLDLDEFITEASEQSSPFLITEFNGGIIRDAERAVLINDRQGDNGPIQRIYVSPMGSRDYSTVNSGTELYTLLQSGTITPSEFTWLSNYWMTRNREFEEL